MVRRHVVGLAVVLSGACAAPRAGHLTSQSLPRYTTAESLASTTTPLSSTTSVASTVDSTPSTSPVSHAGARSAVQRVDARIDVRRATTLLMRDVALLRATPDPGQIAIVAIAKTPFGDDLASELRRLRRDGLRAEVRVPVTSLRVAPPAFPDDHRVFVDTGAGERIERRTDGSIASRTPIAPARWLYTLGVWPDGRWVIADAFELHPEWAQP